MDPIQINITIGLNEKTLDVLQAFAGARAEAPAAPATKPEPKRPETKPEPRKPEVKEDPAPAPQPAEEPKPEQPEAPESKEISDSELRVFIKGIRDQVGSNKAIWDVFADFGIKTSIECPMERRAELMERLNKLVA